MEYIKKPQDIESNSFDIISQIIADHYPDYRFSSDVEAKIIKRAIHTTADFDWLDILKFSPQVVDRMLGLICGGCTVYTDTTMVLSGMNKTLLAQYRCQVRCYIAEQQVANSAKTYGMTRSMAAVDRALTEPGNKLFVFGNAPTGLFRLLESEWGRDEIAVIGVPVGFVGAAESKQALYDSDLPYITALGRKGGSNVAAAIVNALLYHLRDVQ